MTTRMTYWSAITLTIIITILGIRNGFTPFTTAALPVIIIGLGIATIRGAWK